MPRGSETITERPRWPAIVLRTPKGWTGPKDRRRSSHRGHVARASGADRRPEARTRRICNSSKPGCARTGPETLFDAGGRFVRSCRSSPRQGDRRMGANPARQRRPPAARPRRSATTRRTRSPVAHPASHQRRSRPRRLGSVLRDVFTDNRDAANFRLFCPDETNSNRLGAVFEVEKPLPHGSHQGPDDVHVTPVRPRHGSALRASLPGMAARVTSSPAGTGSSRLRGVRDGLGVDGDPARQVARGLSRPRMARTHRVAQHPAHVDLLAQRSQRVQPPGSGAHRHDGLHERKRRPRSTCRPTPTACCRSPITACAAAAT